MDVVPAQTARMVRRRPPHLTIAQPALRSLKATGSASRLCAVTKPLQMFACPRTRWRLLYISIISPAGSLAIHSFTDSASRKSPTGARGARKRQRSAKDTSAPPPIWGNYVAKNAISRHKSSRRVSVGGVRETPKQRPLRASRVRPPESWATQSPAPLPWPGHAPLGADVPWARR